MPIQAPKKINTLDLNSSIGIGVDLPYNNSKVFKTNYTTRDQIKANLINFLLTNQGERVLNPNFGSGLRRLLFSQIGDLDTIKDIIQDKLQINFPNIDVIEIKVTSSIDDHAISISITYDIRASLIQDTIQINVNQ